MILRVLIVATIAAGTPRCADADEHSRLLFARQSAETCDVGIWNSRSGATTRLTTIEKCPTDLYVGNDGREAFVVDGESLILVDIDDPENMQRLQLPDLAWRSWVDDMEVRPDQNVDYAPSVDTLAPTLAGRTEDGSIAVAASLWMPADDTFNYVFRFDGQYWSIIEQRWCDRWGCEEPLSTLTNRSTTLWTWPEGRRVWSERMSSNPYAASRDFDSANSVHTLTFDIDGIESTLRAYIGPSAHYDIVYTFGLELRIEDGPFVDLSAKQCMTSVVGRYILVREFFGGRFEVTDIGTGNTVIGDLVAAMWLE